MYVAEDVTLHRRVAVKLLHGALSEDEGFLGRFRDEARAAAAPRTRTSCGSTTGEDDDGPYLVLELLSGGSLRDILDAGHLLTPSQSLVVGLEAARGLDYAHRRGLVHRDIKPANLLFDDEGACASPTSGWRAPSPKPRSPSPAARCWARPGMWRPSRRAEAHSTAAPTCTPSHS